MAWFRLTAELVSALYCPRATLLVKSVITWVSRLAKSVLPELFSDALWQAMKTNPVAAKMSMIFFMKLCFEMNSQLICIQRGIKFFQWQCCGPLHHFPVLIELAPVQIAFITGGIYLQLILLMCALQQEGFILSVVRFFYRDIVIPAGGPYN